MMKALMGPRSSSRMNRRRSKEKLIRKTINRWNRLRTKINPIHRLSKSDDDGNSATDRATIRLRFARVVKAGHPRYAGLAAECRVATKLPTLR